MRDLWSTLTEMPDTTTFWWHRAKFAPRPTELQKLRQEFHVEVTGSIWMDSDQLKIIEYDDSLWKVCKVHWVYCSLHPKFWVRVLRSSWISVGCCNCMICASTPGKPHFQRTSSWLRILDVHHVYLFSRLIKWRTCSLALVMCGQDSA